MTSAIIARIISEYSDKGTKAAARDLKKSVAEFEQYGHKVKVAFGVATGAALAAAVAIGKSAVQSALDDQKSQALLANALKNTTGATNAQIDAVEKHIKAQMLSLGVSDEQLRPSMIALTAATKNITDATKLQNLALDISAGRGKDLGQVSIALAKAYDGNFTALKRLGIPIDENLIKTHDFNGAVKELYASVHGQAVVAADTFAGRMERVKLGFDEAKKSLGYALMPVLSDFAGQLNKDILPKVEQWIEDNKGSLANGLKNVTGFIGNMVSKGVSFVKFLTDHKGAVKDFLTLTASFLAAEKVFAFASAIGKLVKAWKEVQGAAKLAAAWEAAATDGASIPGAIAALAAFGITGVILGGSTDAKAFNGRTDMSRVPNGVTPYSDHRTNGFINGGGPKFGLMGPSGDSSMTDLNFPNAAKAAPSKSSKTASSKLKIKKGVKSDYSKYYEIHINLPPGTSQDHAKQIAQHLTQRG